MSNKLIRRSFVFLAAASLTVAGGCSSQSKVDKVRADGTPELTTLYQTRNDVKNEDAIAANEDLRMLHQDFRRAFYLDRPSRLTREPIPR
ncbi:MAG: hypothetical protein AAF747_05665 [Planctomycetota bacterium]